LEVRGRLSNLANLAPDKRLAVTFPHPQDTSPVSGFANIDLTGAGPAEPDTVRRPATNFLVEPAIEARTARRCGGDVGGNADAYRPRAIGIWAFCKDAASGIRAAPSGTARNHPPSRFVKSSRMAIADS